MSDVHFVLCDNISLGMEQRCSLNDELLIFTSLCDRTRPAWLQSGKECCVLFFFWLSPWLVTIDAVIVSV